ncbi:hypothetical protein CORC01_03329 [Colletotrichum orchidophilum]|uniref:Uncharacterized protein n=1 Tax=Colletotrichum orchidophilum TaxID=1209926 RepID=A0A1G4BJ11_9PEZI|nr:uncharacterized protein CORC01_03329 [Colletotrichum orchidophilum]OHF01296.1 hypothetical protein CORC01_03329 [Colletotrichum orchidophilum]
MDRIHVLPQNIPFVHRSGCQVQRCRGSGGSEFTAFCSGKRELRPPAVVDLITPTPAPQDGRLLHSLRSIENAERVIVRHCQWSVDATTCIPRQGRSQDTP